MRALYEIDNEILSCVDMETGEILDTEKLDALQMEREAKLEGVALWIKDMKADAAAVKEEADKLTARKKALENKMEGLKAWLLMALNGEKLNTPRCKVYQTHNQRVVIDDEKALVDMFMASPFREKFLRIKDPEIDKNALKDSMKQGYEYEFAHLEETESVVIK
ncbi:MAG: siphovirus Gp157 family protein [Oscillospiraceae bacterium]|nr:siphovirus Gp157 family protein [Oscillospiraceae bacterium]